MPKMNKKEIKDRALVIIDENPGGIRLGTLVEQIRSESPETPRNTIVGSVGDLFWEGHVSKPSRGLYVPISASGDNSVPRNKTEEVAPDSRGIKESVFYEPFAQYLMGELDEATYATELGKAGGKKWETPDVIGVYKPIPGDTIKFQPEIISAEIKTNPQAHVEAFGQAVFYRLFSSKTYIAMPNKMGEENLSRLESLCILFGVGLVLFNHLDKTNPGFTIRVRAQRCSPDMFYVNSFAKRLMDSNKEMFDKLFS